MKVTITYSYNVGTYPFDCFASSCGEIGSGSSYEEAKQRLIEKLEAHFKPAFLPDPEEVEI